MYKRLRKAKRVVQNKCLIEIFFVKNKQIWVMFARLRAISSRNRHVGNFCFVAVVNDV